MRAEVRPTFFDIFEQSKIQPRNPSGRAEGASPTPMNSELRYIASKSLRGQAEPEARIRLRISAFARDLSEFGLLSGFGYRPSEFKFHLRLQRWRRQKKKPKKAAPQALTPAV